MTTLLVPDYGVSTLRDLVPSMAAAQKAEGPWTDALGLPPGTRWVLLLVDGLGAMNLDAAADDAPFLTTQWRNSGGRTITSGAPSTTATSLSSLGTGLTPGEHGIVGYSFRNPFGTGLLNALRWADGVSGFDVQPRLTAFERLAKAGVQVSSVSPQRFEGTGLTVAALRGARFLGVADETDTVRRVELAAEASGWGERSLVYVYERHLDHAGHAHGWRSPQWRSALAHSDALARELRAALGDDVRLVVTGDHGMVDVPFDHRVVVEDEPLLGRGVALVGGEGRFRQLYTRPSEADAVAERWADRLGDAALVVTRDEAVAAGWFGPLARGVAERIGDVLVVPRDDGAVMTRTEPNEFGLVGMHGSLTPDEMNVPLVVV